jgi:hypothetical protein
MKSNFIDRLIDRTFSRGSLSASSHSYSYDDGFNNISIQPAITPEMIKENLQLPEQQQLQHYYFSSMSMSDFSSSSNPQDSIYPKAPLHLHESDSGQTNNKKEKNLDKSYIDFDEYHRTLPRFEDDSHDQLSPDNSDAIIQDNYNSKGMDKTKESKRNTKSKRGISKSKSKEEQKENLIKNEVQIPSHIAEEKVDNNTLNFNSDKESSSKESTIENSGRRVANLPKGTRPEDKNNNNKNTAGQQASELSPLFTRNSPTANASTSSIPPNYHLVSAEEEQQIRYQQKMKEELQEQRQLLRQRIGTGNDSETIVNVSIGRIEVRAISNNNNQKLHTKKAQTLPALSLQDYLNMRFKEARR